ncbi:MAG: DUF3761 domain-containing protein [Sciscionella sp.]
MTHVRAALPVTLALALLAAAGCTATSATTSPSASVPRNTATPTPAQGATPSTSTPPQSSTPPASTAAALDPAATVEAFYAAINTSDYQTAWNLGGDNLGESYAAFAAGFSDTLSDQLTVTSTTGDTVWVDLIAEHTDGTTHEYAGSYTVADGTITHAALRDITPAAPPPSTSAAIPHALCRDGSTSYSLHDQGTCSHHGGVRIWYWH